VYALSLRHLLHVEPVGCKERGREEVRAWFAWAKTIPDERRSEILDAVVGDGLSALHYAVGSNNLNIVKFMVNNGASDYLLHTSCLDYQSLP